MNQYHGMFGMTRIPKLGCDVLEQSADSRHITLLAGTRFYKFNVLDENGQLFPPETILSQLVSLVFNEHSPASLPDFSVLTSLHRDDWATVIMTTFLVSRIIFYLDPGEAFGKQQGFF